MRTTVDIPDEIYGLLKTRAARQKTSVKALLLRGAEAVLKDETPRSLPRLKLPLIASSKPGSLKLDNEKIYDLIGFP